MKLLFTNKFACSARQGGKFSLFCLLIVLILLSISDLSAQRQIFKLNGNYVYKLGTEEPSSNWKDVNFDDSGWTTGFKTIGFGDYDDSTIIPSVPSCYLRIKFNTDSLKGVREATLEVDFDDAFVAYLNGTEIIRVNIGKKGEATPFNKLAERSHEAYFRKTSANKSIIYVSPTPSYRIDSTLFKSLLTSSENILAIQVHNDSINGSDLSFKSALHTTSLWGYDMYSPRDRAISQTTLDSSEFPIVIINTDEYEMPRTGVRYPVSMSIIDNPGKINKITDPATFTGVASIERRGQSSAYFPKISLNIETQDGKGESLDTSLMGMPSDNDWILYSSFADKSMIRNELTFLLGRKLDHYEPRTQYCEVVINGEFQGLYVFTEKIKRGKKRVDVAKRDSLNPAEGGFVFKRDKPDQSRVQFIYPKSDEITKAETDYLNKLLAEYETVLKSPNFLDPVNGYAKYVSGKSLIDYVIVNEFTRNCDAYLNSSYLHKDKNSKDKRIKFGPLWDYDIAFGGASWQEALSPQGWQFALSSSDKFFYVKKLFQDTALTHAFSRRWWNLRSNILSNASIMSTIDSLTGNIEESRIRNYKVWQTEDKFLFGPDHYSSSYNDDVEQMKDWISLRVAWIDANIDKIYYPVTDVNQQFAYNAFLVDAYPNPFVSRLTVTLDSGTGNYSFELRSLDGRLVSMKKQSVSSEQKIVQQFDETDFGKASNGIYMIMVRKNNVLVGSVKILKTVVK